ncbi:MAG: flotillin [Calditrichaeota bacterium]|nr:flotillin [Calditrichota bacterium]
MDFFVALIGIIGMIVIVVGMTISRLLLICHPNEVIILSGRKRKLSDGTIVGYRLIRGGRAIRIPILEKAARMSLEAIPIELSVKNAYSKGGIPLNVEAIANIKINSNEPSFGNAVERFLGKPLTEIHKIAKDTLEGNLRGVLATLTPEEVNEDRLKFAQSLIDEADSDLNQLGLQLDTFKIQNVSDEAGYLDSIGRRKTAEVISEARRAEAIRAAEAEETEAQSRRQAEIAKAKAEQDIKSAQIDAEKEVKTAQAIASAAARKAEAEQQAAAEAAEAAAQQNAEVAKAKAQQEIRTARIQADREVQVNDAVAQQTIETEKNNLRIKKAELEREAIIKEKEAEVAGEKARAKYEQEMEEERIILQQKRLMADVIEPARAEKEAMELDAQGKAAPILEKGKANLEILARMIKVYQSAEGEGEKVFMLNMLPEIVKQLTDTINKITIDKVSVIDSGDGKGNGVGRFINQLPAALISLSEQIENATGVNILSQFQKHDISLEQLEQLLEKNGVAVNENGGGEAGETPKAPENKG